MKKRENKFFHFEFRIYGGHVCSSMKGKTLLDRMISDTLMDYTSKRPAIVQR